MDKDTFKAYCMRDRGFLKSLYEGENRLKNNKILNVASDTKLNTLIRLLHFISNGEIKILKENFEVIRDARKLNILKRHVEKKSTLIRLLKGERVDKLKFLKQFSSVYSSILYIFFNEI